ncbi:MAG: 3-isopropylmalate dehydratase small subunit [Sulfobacillus benefaciens]|uniref:3-isopropylmalate dehydratase small subunit n=1 Tax=Sulfobacillus benefaciens TaxID=453960 RepID=A0A2T2XEU5_9FIRM|nr:MAG: 3-isopropylmalate dehydratase small subunit [Sulfobacillus benefaciens]
MKPLTQHRGRAIPLERANVDTDQIIPKQFLKRVERTGFGQFLFFDWRFAEDGSERPDFILNQPQYRHGTILLAGPNFGSGSSREHAPWALQDWGLAAVIAPSFADIFYNNCLKNGLLPIPLAEGDVSRLMDQAKGSEGLWLTIDVAARTVTTDSGEVFSFPLDDYARESLLQGLDDIGRTLVFAPEIDAYENRVKPRVNTLG